MKNISLKRRKRQQRRNIMTIVVCALFAVVLSFAIYLSGYDWHAENIFGGFAPVGTSASISGAIPEASEKEEWEYFDDTVFVGDSISFGMASYNYLSFDHVFAKIGLHQGTALNTKCVYTSKTQNYTISEALKMAKPGKVIITLGINAIYNYKEDSFYNQYESLIEKIKTATPDSKIIIQSIFPVTESWANANGKPNCHQYIAYANQKLYDLASSNDCYFLYTYEKLTDENGFLQLQYSGDGIHLSRQGYDAVFEYILSHSIVSSGYFTEIGAIRPPVVQNNNSSTVSMPDISVESGLSSSDIDSSDLESSTSSGDPNSSEITSDNSSETLSDSSNSSSDNSSKTSSDNSSNTSSDNQSGTSSKVSSKDSDDSSSKSSSKDKDNSSKVSSKDKDDSSSEASSKDKDNSSKTSSKDKDDSSSEASSKDKDNSSKVSSKDKEDSSSESSSKDKDNSSKASSEDSDSSSEASSNDDDNQSSEEEKEQENNGNSSEE